MCSAAEALDDFNEPMSLMTRVHLPQPTVTWLPTLSITVSKHLICLDEPLLILAKKLSSFFSILEL